MLNSLFSHGNILNFDKIIYSVEKVHSFGPVQLLELIMACRNFTDLVIHLFLQYSGIVWRRFIKIFIIMTVRRIKEFFIFLFFSWCGKIYNIANLVDCCTVITNRLLPQTILFCLAKTFMINKYVST